MAFHEQDAVDKSDITPCINVPCKLSGLAANSIVRLLVYEDYEDCNFYRWDPVTIWQFETHQPKKKKSAKKCVIENVSYGHPPPPWKGVKSLRNWWCDESSHLLGHPTESPLRQLVVNALEKQSWTSHSEEEDILFLLLRLCMETQLHFTRKSINESWYADLAQIIENLGPFLLEKLVIENDVFQGNTLIPSTIIQKSPRLLVLRIGQWELSNEILYSLSQNCPLLQEFSIHGMEPDVFMSDEAFFKCFFSGLLPEKVLEHHKNQTSLQVSFVNLKYVDMLFCKQTERFILMLAYFYPSVSVSAFDISSDSNSLINSFFEKNIKLPFLRFSCRPENVMEEKLPSYIRNSSLLKEICLDIDNKFPGADSEVLFNKHLEKSGEKLKDLIGENTKSLDSFAVKCHPEVNMSKVLLPALGSHGSLLRCLHFVFSSSIPINTLYQLLNLCPLLEKLIIEMQPTGNDSSSRAFRTTLKELSGLETLVILQPEEVSEEEEEEPNEECMTTFCTLIQDLLHCSPNIKNFAIYIPDCCCLESLMLSLKARSVERLQLNLGEIAFTLEWVPFLSYFPSLKLLSLQGEPDAIWPETLEDLGRRGINVTKKSQEFTNVFRWYQNVQFSKSVYIQFV
ncbi:UNVERIFIED_CONTAM: hypothetical protein RMT77_000473 [Armadillidium vulgare]